MTLYDFITHKPSTTSYEIQNTSFEKNEMKYSFRFLEEVKRGRCSFLLRIQ